MTYMMTVIGMYCLLGQTPVDKATFFIGEIKGEQKDILEFYNKTTKKAIDAKCHNIAASIKVVQSDK